MSTADARLNDLSGRVAKQAQVLDRHDLASWLRSAAGHGAPVAKPILMVVGETQSGKSRLVNALVGVAGLSPAGAGVATSEYLFFGNEPASGVTVRRHGEDDLQIAREEIANWATVTEIGEPVSGEVEWLEIGADAPLLEELTLVDTPGVGGPVLGHVELAVGALDQASAVLFVTDAGAPISRPELEFLKRAGDRIDTVIVALAKTDLHYGWEVIADENRQLLREHGGRLADVPVVGVSAALFEKSIGLGDAEPELREKMRSRSQVGVLESEVRRRVVDRAEHLAAANRLRVCEWVLAELSRILTERVKALSSPEDRRRLEEEKGELKRLAKAAPPAFARSLSTVQREMSNGLDTSLDHLEFTYREKVSTSKGPALEALPDELEADLTGLAESLCQEFDARVAASVRAACPELSDSQVESLAMVDAQGVGDLRRGGDEGGLDLSEELVVSLGPVMTGSFLAMRMPAMMAMVGAGAVAWIGVPIGLAIGATTLLLGRGMRKRVKDRAATRETCQAQVRQARRSLGHALAEAAKDARHAFPERLGAYAQLRMDEISDLIAGLRDEGGRDRLRALDRQRAEVREMADEVDRVAAELSRAAASDAEAPTAEAVSQAGGEADEGGPARGQDDDWGSFADEV